MNHHTLTVVLTAALIFAGAHAAATTLLPPPAAAACTLLPPPSEGGGKGVGEALSLQTAAAARDASAQQTEPDDPILQGPTVKNDGRSIVRFDMSGNLIAVQGRPEIVAVALLPMPPERRDDIRLINEERRTEVALHLADNIDILREITDAIRAGENQTAQRLSRSLYRKLHPEHVRDILVERYAEVLTEEELSETRRVLDEYWAILIDRTMRRDNDMNAGNVDEIDPDQADALRQSVEERLAFEIFQQEIREAYNWSLRPYQQKIERISEIVSPTDEQRQEIRMAIIDFIREARLEPTEELHRKTARRIYEILDEDQRRELFDYVWWRLE